MTRGPCEATYCELAHDYLGHHCPSADECTCTCGAAVERRDCTGPNALHEHDCSLYDWQGEC